MPDTDPAYIAVRQDCDCVVAAMVDRPEYAKDNAREVSRLIRQGYRIINTTVGEGRAMTWAYPCEHELAAKANASDSNQLTLEGVVARP